MKYTQNDLNNIRRTFKNFNAKVRYNKNKTRSKGMLPKAVKFSEFRDKYSDKSRREMEKQLKLYQSFGNRSSLKKASPDSRISKWELEYFKANESKTRQFYRDEIEDLERIIGEKPDYYLRMHDRLTNLKRKQEKLDLDLATLDEDQIKMMRSIYNYAERSEVVKKSGFRLYLSQLERTMKNLGYSKSERDSVLNKFNNLSENEFLEMMRNENLIDRVYDLVDSPKGRGQYELMLEENSAREIVNEIINTADSLISKYKTS